MPYGNAVFVLHAHLPYVLSHGKWPHGSDWLCEAACETYIPLLNTLGILSREGKRANLTVGITPVLCEMLASPRFRDALKSYIEEKRRAAALDRRSFKALGRTDMSSLAARWDAFYAHRLKDFTETYKEDLVRAFRSFQEECQIEIITSAATHAYLPLIRRDACISAQISQGVETFKRHFKKPPEGMWLPECAYRPGRAGSGTGTKGLEAYLAEHGLKYFFVDGSQVVGGDDEADRTGSRHYPFDTCAGRFGVHGAPYSRSRGTLLTAPLFAPHLVSDEPGSRCAFFPRDTDTSLQVWSADWGYPGDPWYLEFHKKHAPGGLRYWRVTDHRGDLGSKLVYEPERATGRLKEHARHFARLIESRLRGHFRATGKQGVLTLPFDAELFGHWWFEGIDWLYELVYALDAHYATIEKASAVLKSTTPTEKISLSEGSWGEGGLHDIWQNEKTAWTWQRIREVEDEMVEAVRKTPRNSASSRILKQMARELFLLESSDWQFLITTEGARDYAESRFAGHSDAFEELHRMLKKYGAGKRMPAAPSRMLSALEDRDAVFEDVNLEWFEERISDGL
jgi:1,4-alpha-glucan branching enzyme